MKTINYKGRGNHSVSELELIIEQQAEELHLFKSGQKAINYAHSSTLLKDKEAPTFEEYVKNEKIEKIGLVKYIDREGYNVSLAELTRRYKRYKSNL